MDIVKLYLEQNMLCDRVIWLERWEGLLLYKRCAYRCLWMTVMKTLGILVSAALFLGSASAATVSPF